MDSSNSLQIDEHLARLLAAYDPGIEGGDNKAPTIGVPAAVPPVFLQPGERVVPPLSSSAANEGSVRELLPDSSRDSSTTTPRPGQIYPITNNGPHRIGRFELRRQLGKGGCGIVFLAYDPKLQREVALKIPRPEMLLSSDARKRLVREALAAAEFDHPNLVPVYETGEIGPVCFIATAFCPGQTLGEWLDKQAFPVPLRQTARLVATVAEAVQHAHDRGVLHRDLKPNNVILQATKDDPQEQEPPPGSCQLRGEQYIPRVVDFGLAKLMERGGPSETTTRQILGTPKYMAPEQAMARHADVGPTADVYALGVILYEMLSGRAPYEGTSDVDVLRQSIDGKMTHPRHIRGDIPRDLEAICLKAMSKSPDRRYRTAIDLADDLRRFLDGKPTIARPLKWPGRALRWLRRNDQLVALVVVTTVALVLFAVGSFYIDQTRRLKVDQDRTQREQEARTASDQQHRYSRYVREAFLAWRSGDTKAARDAIESARRIATMGRDGTEFTAEYLTSLLKAERLAIACPAGRVTALAVSPDGKRLASGHADGTLAVWDRTTGEQLSSVKAHDGEIAQAVFGLGGERLVTVGAQRAGAEGALCWTVSSTGGLLAASEPNRVIARNVSCLDVSADGNTIYAGALNGWLHAVNFVDPAQNRSVQTKIADQIAAIAINKNGKELLIGTGGGRILCFSTGLEQQDYERAFGGSIKSVLPDSSLGGYSVGLSDGRVFMVPLVYQGFEIVAGARLSWLAALPNGGFATNDVTGRVLVVGKHRYSLPTGDAGTVRAGVATRDGKTLFTGGDDGIIRSWDLATDLRDRAATDLGSVTAVGIHQDGERIVVQTGSNLLVDHLGTDRETQIRLPNPSRRFISLQVPKESRLNQNIVGVEARDGAVLLCELNNNVSIEQKRFTLPDGATAVSAQFSGDGSQLAVGDDRGRVIVWSVPNRTLMATIDCGHRRPIRHVVISDDGKFVAAQAAGNSIGVWNVVDQTSGVSVPADDQTVFRFLSGGERLATAGRGGVIRVWTIPSGREEMALYGHVGRVTGLGVSPDGRTLVSGGTNGEVKFWDARTGQELIGLRRHTEPVTMIEFAANGRLLVTGGSGQIAVWEAKE